MKVLKIRESEISKIFRNSSIIAHGKHFSINQEIILDLNNLFLGPVKVIDIVDKEVIFEPSEKFNYYIHNDSPDVEINELESIVMPLNAYESVTGNIYLDGLISAAYIDHDDVIRIDIEKNPPGLKDYYTDAMELTGIDYHIVEEGYIIDDYETVNLIFKKFSPFNPVQYMIGHLSSFVSDLRLMNHKFPEYSKFAIMLSKGYDIGNEFIQNLYISSYSGKPCLSTFFGSMDPFKSLIKSMDTSDDSDLSLIFQKSNNEFSVRNVVFPMIIKKLFYYAGLDPIEKNNEKILSVLKNKYYDERVTVSISESDESDIVDTDYSIHLKDGLAIIIYNKASHECPLFYNSIFDFGQEMSSYFEILFKKL